MVCIDEMQFGFVPGKGATDAIFIVRQLQERYISVKKPLFFVLLTLKKPLILYQVVGLKTLGVEEWTAQIIQGMYANGLKSLFLVLVWIF